MNKRDRIARARKAGSVKSELKAKSSRANGAKGGRPTNQQIADYMKEHQCSRSTAYRRLKSGAGT